MNSNDLNSNKDKKTSDEEVEIRIEGEDEQAVDIKIDEDDELVEVEIDDKVIEILQSEYEGLKKALEEEKDKANCAVNDLKYVQADFVNYKKTLDKDKQEYVRYAEKNILKDVLDVYDNFERALENLNSQDTLDPSVKKGFQMIFDQVKSLLEKREVKPIETEGKQFDPYLHEVMMSEETEDHPEDYILQELRKGYYLRDKVLRTSFVKIAKPPKKEEKKENSDDN